MKVKRIIKAFIYLMPIGIFIFNAIFLCTNPYRLSSVPDVAYPYNSNIDNADYVSVYKWQPSRDFIMYTRILESYDFFNSDDTPLYDVYRQLLYNAGLKDDDIGSYLDFATCFLTYETYALLINVIIDVLFIVPELIYKFEDESIMSRKKKRR